ncbi:hypothetical protein ACO1O0_007651 [Amphichorda felina]
MAPKDGPPITDIGGSRIDMTLGHQLPLAFQAQGDFPKEVAYTAGMEKWFDIAGTSYQTAHELEIIEQTAHHVVSEMSDGTTIIDLGAANSTKYEAYVRAFLEQGKTCTYVALDIEHKSLVEQICRAQNRFPEIQCFGLWGSFEDGDRFYKQISGPRLFLSLGSIFFNAPDDICDDRCNEFHRHMGPGDRLIVGQDGPSGAHGAQSHASYQTEAYSAFITQYLKSVQQLAGVDADPKKTWSVQSKMDLSKHWFEVTTLKPLTLLNFDNYEVKAGTSYTIFPSWKRGEEEIHEVATGQDLAIRTLGKADKSGMRQYIIQSKKM